MLKKDDVLGIIDEIVNENYENLFVDAYSIVNDIKKRIIGISEKKYYEPGKLIYGPHVLGGYYVRPINWAGEWDKEGKLSGGNVIAIFTDKEDARRYCEADKSSKK